MLLENMVAVKYISVHGSGNPELYDPTDMCQHQTNTSQTVGQLSGDTPCKTVG